MLPACYIITSSLRRESVAFCFYDNRPDIMQQYLTTAWRLISESSTIERTMLRPLHGLTPLLRSRPIVARYGPVIATAAYGHHPNRGNFANRSREELSAMGHRGGKKSGKARGTGGFHDMDPKKQVRSESCSSDRGDSQVLIQIA